MDVLSDVLSLLRVRSTISSRFEGHGAWCFRFPSYEHVKFGCVRSGRLFLWMEDGGAPVQLEEGDFYLLTAGQPFHSASDPASIPMDGPTAYRAMRGDDGVFRYRGAGPQGVVALATGRFVFANEAAAMLLDQLPPLIHLRAADIGAHALSHVLELLIAETGAARPGADVTQASLAVLVLVQALRAFLASAAQPPGWLGALTDPKIGAALSAMHASPAGRWTVESLAGVAAMSRTAFASRFRKLVGQPPLDYMRQWRMALARTELRASDLPLATIAGKIGYQSETAFSIAFKRAMGQSPGRYRNAVS